MSEPRRCVGERPAQQPSWNSPAEKTNDELEAFTEAARTMIAMD
jgi:hypothetical protein